MSLYASGVNISPDLSKAISGIGTNSYNQINSNYGAAKKKLSSDAVARGMSGNAAVAPNSYAGQRLGANQGLDIGGLESALGGGLGNTGYQDTLAQRDFGQQEQLAEEAARLNKPSLLDQIFQGIGAVGKPAATYAGAGGFKSKPPTDPFSGVYGNV